ncbi:MAG TPA: hypothetical protein VNG53_02705 [Bacteroidia bacterium]|nr:hypothetical protein [Bacteroidia bacterium]
MKTKNSKKVIFSPNGFLLTTAFIAIIFLMNSCGNQSNQDTKNQAAKKDSVVTKTTVDSSKTTKTVTDTNVVFDRTFNDVSRYIAGMPQEPGSQFEALDKDTAWIRHARIFDQAWSMLEARRLKPMEKWSNTELASEHKANLNVFYPLSGPDILHVNAFFQNAKQYNLYALERAGALPDLKHLTESERSNYLNDIYTSLSDVFKKSYFITHKMLSDLQRENVNGTLPLICVFLVRTNHKIVNVKYFHLNDDGSETELNKDSAAVHTNDFVKVYFRNNKDNSMQVVTYMKCDLSDGALAKNKGMMAWIKNMPTSITYLKSASYLLHYKFFTLLRNFILDKSASILEDDTGIPYKYLTSDKWSVSLYGTYVIPVKDFKGVTQTNLETAYKDSAKYIKQLPFSLGYHWGTNDQNLIKAERK